MKRLHLLSIIAASIALSACVTTGGGITPDKLTRPIRADDKPYIGELDAAHSKTSWITPGHKLKPNVQWDVVAVRSGHFTKDGSVAMFIAPNAYPFLTSKNNKQVLVGDGGMKEVTLAEVRKNPANYSPFGIWKIDADNKPVEKLFDLGRGCMQPYKALVADFNKDGIDDVFVVCTGAALDGLDKEDFRTLGDATEKNRIVLSDGKGGFTNAEVGENGMAHGGDVADVNGDGYPDVVVSNMGSNLPVYFFINQKDGTFKKDTNRIVGGLQGKHFTVLKLVDIDGDGLVDLAVGGSGGDFYAPAYPGQILFGDADGKFGRERMAIPSVPGRDLYLDMLPVTNNGERILYVYRTSDATSKLPCCFDHGAYATETLQAVNLTTGKTSVVFDNMMELNRTPVGTFYSVRPVTERGWMPMTRNGQKGITPANDLLDHLFVVDGKLVGVK